MNVNLRWKVFYGWSILRMEVGVKCSASEAVNFVFRPIFVFHIEEFEIGQV